MGARTAMTVACRHPDRIDGCISIDAAPVNESGNEAFGSFAK
jgi:pimeloyl-ACP methyl ester carboxylesterase